jgi:hypothetical protein
MVLKPCPWSEERFMISYPDLNRDNSFDVLWDDFDLYERRNGKVTAKTDTKVCSICGQVIEIGSEYTVVNGETVCNDCKEDNLSVCEHCGMYILTDNAHKFDDKVWCEHCLREETLRCEDCGERIYRDNAIYTTHGDYVCQDCIEEHYVCCVNCDEFVHIDYAEYDIRSGNYYCESCWEDRYDDIIESYHYKPTPIFYGENDPLYMGVELEIDNAGEDGENAMQLDSIVNNGKRHIYFKHDGSIDEGFEIVSHPATLEYHTNNIRWADMMVAALDMGYRSHETSTCGLHVHVSREALGVDYDEREDTISKIIYFTELHWNEILKFTRRTASKMERWARRYGIIENTEKTYKNAKDYSGDRYRCINLTNESTVEFRMFRGTLRYQTFLATLQFVHEVCTICREYNSETIEALAWTDFVKRIDSEKKPELVAYLKERELFPVDGDSDVEEDY